MSVYTLSLCIFFFFILLLGKSTSSVDPEYQKCVPTNCGNGHSISYPFYIRDSDNQFICGYPGFEVTCGENGYPLLHIPDNNYTIDQINYGNNTFRVLNTAVSRSGRDCVPEIRNTTLERDKFQFVSEFNLFLFSNCSSELPPELYGDGCGGGRRLVVMGNDGRLGLAEEECGGKVVVPVEEYGGGDGGFAEYLEILRRGFLLRWTAGDCTVCTASGGRCGFDMDSYHFNCFCPDRPHAKRCNTRSVHNKIKRIVLGAGAGAALGIVLFICFLSYYNKKSSSSLDFLKMKRTTPNDRMIETFLRQHGSMAPRRYRYSELKKFTNSFRHELGKGGYGRVYKGSLPNNRLVAVKVLNESKRNGEEFVNEVASIGRTSHVNIVSLLGFCYEGRKSALVYEFMPNKSLENFINYDKPVSGNHQLGCEKLIEIATGIACGLEYLHRGCNTPILHLDIKPHNILLDWDFCPKISDFGLSKLCLGKDNVVSMSEARGTIGYIAPEVFNRSFGVVSHKSDVYSYGMMVLEMVGGRHNVDIGVVRSSETYFPHWIYMRLELDNDLKLPGFRSDTENETARKMIIVGLWCIQTNPSQRPSMSKVLEMLEGSIETLQIPPKPFLYSPPRSVADSSCQVEIYG